MKLTRLFLAALVMLAFSTASFAQEKKAETKTEAKAKAKEKKAAATDTTSTKKAAAPIKAGLDPALCQAMTKDGDQCKRKPSAGSKFCWQHGGKKSGDAPAAKKKAS